MGKPLYLTTIQDSQDDDTCGMKHWYTSIHGGAGTIAKAAVIPTQILDQTYEDLRMVAYMEDITQPSVQAAITEILAGLTPEEHKDIRKKELLYRRLGWFAAYALFVEPGIREHFVTLPIDPYVDLDRDPLWIRVQTGRVLRNRRTQELIHQEFIPTSTIMAKWRNMWEFNLRPHISLIAVREALKLRVDVAQVMGLSTGFVGSTGVLRHPYVYAYFNKGTGEWSNAWKSLESGEWVERPIWEYPHSLTDWVRRCGSSVAETQFPLSSNIGLNPNMVQNWITRRTFRERQIQGIKEGCYGGDSLRATYFPQNTAHCAPLMGDPCTFKSLCWSAPFMRAALLSTEFELKTKKEVKEAKEVNGNRLKVLDPFDVKTPTLSERLEAAMNTPPDDNPALSSVEARTYAD